MRAILLAAGLGRRLRPFTDKTPKCLAPIHGKPLLGYWLDSLAKAGIESVLINLHHHADQVRRFVANREDGHRITLAYEESLLGTGGTVQTNAAFCLDGPTMIIHSDNFCLSDLSKFIYAHQHRPDKADITMMTFVSDNPSSCGIVKVNSSNIVTEFHEKVKEPPGRLANGAVYIFEPSVIRSIASMTLEQLDLSKDVLPKYLGKIFAWQADGIHIDVGTPLQLDRANRFAKEARCVA